ncbi:MAG: hypothetical protein GWN41_02880 [Phycisphaerae bacterium]|nr:hypothetical protein [Phycisphaerae bacterium]
MQRFSVLCLLWNGRGGLTYGGDFDNVVSKLTVEEVLNRIQGKSIKSRA